jgi:hypothetical protein
VWPVSICVGCYVYIYMGCPQYSMLYGLAVEIVVGTIDWATSSGVVQLCVLPTWRSQLAGIKGVYCLLSHRLHGVHAACVCTAVCC